MNTIISRLYFRTVLQNEDMRSDLYRYYGAVSKEAFLRAIADPGYYFTLHWRCAKAKKKTTLFGFLSRVFYKQAFVRFGYQIPRAVAIGKGLRISHFGGLVINMEAVIGDNCYLSHGVTIGKTNRGVLKGVPMIGDYVWIGPGAVIVGAVTIGDNVLIAPNAYVNVSVPSNSIVIGNPAKIFSKENATEGYITNVVV